MKKTLIISFILISFSLIGQKKYPSYETVVKEFFNTYSVKNLQQFSFEKRPTGWCTSVYDYNKNEYVNSTIFWSSKSKKYKKLDFDKVDDQIDNNQNINYFINKYESKQFKTQPYYNYPGWDWDVIQKLKDKKKLSDTLINALARAYSSYSINLLNNNTGKSNKEIRFNLPYGENSMSAEQLAKYRKYQHKAIFEFERLAKQNPKFEVIVGNISIKASNEYVTSFLNLLTYQNEEEARKEIKPGLYNKMYINLAKEYLSTCEKNAILFTNGDNDTYPLLYVQAQYNYRSDVKIVNISLLNTDRYIDLIQKNTFGAVPVKISFEHKHYEKSTNSYMPIDEKGYAENTSLSEIIDWVKSEDESTMLDLNSGGKIKFIPTKKFTFPAPKDSYIENISWEYNHNYMSKADLIILDILASNNWDRPIYFAITVGKQNYLGLENYFRFDGMAYRLMPKYTEKDYLVTGYVNTDILYKNVMQKYEYTKLSDCKTYIGETEKQALRNNLNIFYRLSSTLISEGDSTKAKQVMDKCFKLYPNKDISFGYYALLMGENYYKLNEIEKAREILFVIYNNQKEIIKTGNEKERERAYAMQQMILKYTITYNDKESEEKILEDNNIPGN